MKRMMKFSFFMCILFAVLFILYYMNAQSENHSLQLADDAGRFTFICPKVNDGYWSSVAYGMMRQDQIQGTNTKFVGPTQYTAEEVCMAVNAAVNSNVDGIITAGSRVDEEVIDALKTASQKQIPIVLVDTDTVQIDRICYIGTDNYAAGQLAARDMLEASSEPVRAAVILVSLSSENQENRLKGFQDELSAHPDCGVVSVLEADSNFLYLNEMLPRTLKENPEINAIFCAEEFSATVVGRILTSMGSEYDDICVVAFDKMDDTLAYVESGRYFSTIVQQSDRMGELAVKVLEDYLNGILPEKDIIYTDSLSIRKENLEDIERYESEGVTWHSYTGNL